MYILKMQLHVFKRTVQVRDYPTIFELQYFTCYLYAHLYFDISNVSKAEIINSLVIHWDIMSVGIEKTCC